MTASSAQTPAPSSACLASHSLATASFRATSNEPRARRARSSATMRSRSFVGSRAIRSPSSSRCRGSRRTICTSAAPAAIVWRATVFSIFVLLATASTALRRHRFDRRMLQMANFDALTDLPNRAQVRDRLDAIFKLPADQRNFALHIVDLDGFKFVNDTYGHRKGDELLRVVASACRRKRPTATSSRGWAATSSQSFSGSTTSLPIPLRSPIGSSGVFRNLIRSVGST